MNVIGMPGEITIVANLVFPEAALSQAGFMPLVLRIRQVLRAE